MLIIENHYKEQYAQIKQKRKRGTYQEEIHCPMILQIMSTEGTMTAFCYEAAISDSLFYKWLSKYPVFKDCYELGKVISRYNWEKEGEENKDNEEFNLDYWRIKGACRYGFGKNKIRMAVDPKADPYTQYQQLIEQAGTEEFTASEVKQLMEAINVGRGAYETFELQKALDQMKKDIVKMNHANNSSAN